MIVSGGTVVDKGPQSGGTVVDKGPLGLGTSVVFVGNFLKYLSKAITHGTIHKI